MDLAKRELSERAGFVGGGKSQAVSVNRGAGGAASAGTGEGSSDDDDVTGRPPTSPLNILIVEG
jgi:hypothetical protein